MRDAPRAKNEIVERWQVHVLARSERRAPEASNSSATCRRRRAARIGTPTWCTAGPWAIVVALAPAIACSSAEASRDEPGAETDARTDQHVVGPPRALDAALDGGSLDVTRADGAGEASAQGPDDGAGQESPLGAPDVREAGNADAPITVDDGNASPPANAADASAQRDGNGVALDAGALRADAAAADRGPFEPVDGAADGQALSFRPWPGGQQVSEVDPAGTYAGNLSGLAYDPASGAGSADVLWGVQNDPSTLYQLGSDGPNWVALDSNGWHAGKRLHYPNGEGDPDAEGVTVAEQGTATVYVAAERDNQNKLVSRLSVLRFDVSAPGDVLTATHEWDLTPDLPAVPANDGLEAITWVPDSALTAFVDQSTGATYQPARYPDHGSGVFFVGVEATGMIYAYALDAAGPGFHRLGAIPSGQRAVMDLSFDRDVNQLWAYCDDTCGNRATILSIAATATATAGGFVVRAAYERPGGMPDLNNEGIALARESSCSGGQKNFFWADDGASGGHSIRRGSVTCGALP